MESTESNLYGWSTKKKREQLEYRLKLKKKQLDTYKSETLRLENDIAEIERELSFWN